MRITAGDYSSTFQTDSDLMIYTQGPPTKACVLVDEMDETVNFAVALRLAPNQTSQPSRKSNSYSFYRMP